MFDAERVGPPPNLSATLRQAPRTIVNREQGQKTMVNGLKSQQNRAEETWRVFRIVRAATVRRAAGFNQRGRPRWLKPAARYVATRCLSLEYESHLCFGSRWFIM